MRQAADSRELPIAASTTFARVCPNVPFVGRPRVHNESRITTAVRLPESLHERLKAAALDRDVSVNLIVTRALSEFLDDLVPSEALFSSPPVAYRDRGWRR